ncbi:hypothetical protein NE237_018463 [Protea cynaroides]|uniref:Uncharacterized protein n=1 Tax=Protea cynaroides TaxID=273540 RepID=A0A9Q0QP73_9MAGN|nr:hypothetical protein NE237_018463 [Protea cynaroides]
MAKSGSFRLQGVNSFMLVGRCHSSIQLSETISEECDKIATYERISQSMRFSGDNEFSPERPIKKKKQSWVSVIWIFSKQGPGGRNDKIKEDAAAAGSNKLGEKKKWWRFSWLPDPDRRWPIQGW